MNNKNALKEIADAYISQYSNPTFDETIMFKESLDHYIVKMTNENQNFAESVEFKNYITYLSYIVKNRKNNGLFLELNTNIALRNEVSKKQVLRYAQEENINQIEDNIKKNKNVINNINEKMVQGIALTQSEVTLISDYLYTSRDNSNNIYYNFIKYILKETPNITFCNEIGAAYIAFMPHIYTKDGVKDSRVVLSNGYGGMNGTKVLPSVLNKANLKQTGPHCREERVVSFDAKWMNGLNLNSSLSMNISRTFKSENRDLYWLSFITFHELTHTTQYIKKKSKDLNSSALAMIIRDLTSDYRNNHDTYEMEIEADEMGWFQMSRLILKYKESITNYSDLFKKCLINQDAIFSRRAILAKKDSDAEDYFRQDMISIQKDFNMDEKESNLKYGYDYKKKFAYYYKNYPMLQKIFLPNSVVKTSILYEDISSGNEGALDNVGKGKNIIGSQLANYILKYGFSKLIENLAKDELSGNQIVALLSNIYNSCHLSKITIRALDNVDFKQFKETNHNISMMEFEEKILEKYFYHFRNVAELVYKERKVVSILKNKYPKINIENIYESTNDVVLNSLAQMAKEKIGGQISPSSRVR